MDEMEVVEMFRDMVLESDLPRVEIGLCGVKCPYCGKSDRIYKLEEPERLKDVPEDYTTLWNRFRLKGELATCKFCRQILVLSASETTASGLES